MIKPGDYIGAVARDGTALKSGDQVYLADGTITTVHVRSGSLVWHTGGACEPWEIDRLCYRDMALNLRLPKGVHWRMARLLREVASILADYDITDNDIRNRVIEMAIELEEES